uniref:Potassium calcium-activated channel subfamily U member 1 n=1 Tax=Aquila chrysaetos chrysaetos TaxID=223781 RepID=A0A663E604_AQUCH
YVDTGFNAFFLLYFGLRFVAADDKLRFWLELNSLVDFFTIPPVFVSYYLKRNWLGLRFLRALRLLELPRILQFLRITKNNYSIKLSKLFAIFISTWLTAAGFIHLVENHGDPWVQPANSQSLSYFKCMYLVMMTMSTVGYGDVVVQTTLGRTFIIFFIIGGLVLFANFIPEVVEIVESHKNYKSSYEVVSGKNYIVVCGNITLESVTTFLRDFLLRDKGNVCTEILFLGESLPSLELEAVFKCYSAYTTFFYGSALNSEDLKRVGVRTSSFIYTSRSSTYLSGDSIICFAELKLGFIAQSCLVPGLSTLLTNLFIVKEDTEVCPSLVLNKDYKVMTSQLSNDFADMTFIEVCRYVVQMWLFFCYFVPDVSFHILPNSLLFSRAQFYCKACHSDIQDPEQIKKCQCKSRLYSKPFSEENSRVILDLTGMFHWCDAVPLQEALLNCKDQAAPNLKDHILVCVFGDGNSPLIGLQDFVMPLRASNFIYHELKDIVFLGSLEYLQREWKFIQNFPKLCALSCADLRAVNVQDCAACALLSSNITASSSPSLVDTESILATLNIRSMQGKSSSAPLGKRVVMHKYCQKTLNIIKDYFKYTEKLQTLCLITFSRFSLENLVFLSKACSFVFDLSLPFQTYYNHHILALLQTLVTSGTSPALGEQLLEEGSRLHRNPDNMIYNASQVRCKLALLPLSKRLLTEVMQEDCFGDIYCRALDLFGILCFGLYRLMEEPNPYKNRFVIARPASDLKMLSTDLLFCVVPFNIATTDDLKEPKQDITRQLSLCNFTREPINRSLKLGNKVLVLFLF